MDNDGVIVSELGPFGKIRNALIVGIVVVIIAALTFLIFASGSIIVTVGWLVIVAFAIVNYLTKGGNVKRITVSPEYINLEYRFKKVGRVVLYKQIDSIQNYHSNGCKQVVNLTDGSTIEFSDTDYDNYDDLKNNIFRYMVAANKRAAAEAERIAPGSSVENDVIVSEVGKVYYIRIYAFLIALAACTIMSGYDFLVNGHDGYWALVLVLIITGILGRIFYVGNIKRLTVSPDYMIIDYMGNKAQEVVDYTQIVSNRNLSFIERGGKNSVGGYRKQLIDLDDGRQLIYTDLKFDNYEDLKNHIYRYMVAANQKR